MDDQIFLFILIGFLAQIIDGSLGMAYGVSSNALLLGMGLSPLSASASLHMAEVFTTAVSGFSHWKLGNIDKDLIKRLVLPGILGGVLGAYILRSVDGNIIKPYISAYLLIMGGVILYKALRKGAENQTVTTHIIPLGVAGGFLDAIGGGGWGPMVTTTLMARGSHPRYTIGSVNLSEFFVTFSESVAFFFLAGSELRWTIVLGLLLGGAAAAPLAAVMTRRIPMRALMGIVGVLIVFLSARTIWMSF